MEPRKKAEIIKNPAGTFSVVGRVPATCLNLHDPPTAYDVMSGRIFYRNGRPIGWTGRAFETREAAQEAIDEAETPAGAP